MRRCTLALLFLAVFAKAGLGADWYVAPGGTDGAGHGTNPGDPFATLGFAISAAAAGDTVNAAAGVYAESDLFVNKTLTIRGAGRTATTVDAAYAGVVFFLYGTTNRIEIEDLTITRGWGLDGGGVLNVGATGVLRRCNVTENYSDFFGGGARNAYGDLRLTQCVVQDNWARVGGGGAYASSLDSSVLDYNVSSNGGGAIYSKLYNCTVVTNLAERGGGLLWSEAYNSIVRYNAATEEPDTHNYKETTFADSLMAPLAEGDGNIDEPPVFLDGPGGNYRLFITSPCINRGRPEHVQGPEDLDGADRQFDGLPDMGAFEFTLLSVPARIPVLSGPLSFMDTQVGQATTNIWWIGNRGNTDLTVYGFTAPVGFSASIADPVVAPGASNPVEVVFAPGAEGLHEGVLKVLTDLTWGPDSTSVAGTGIAAPAIRVTPGSVSRTTVAGLNPAPVSVDVANTGSGELSFTASSSAAWLTTDPAAGLVGETPVPMALVFDAAALAAGVHAATVTVSSAEATNSPAYVTVTLTLTDPPELDVAAGALVAACPAGANAEPLYFQVRNAGLGTLAFETQADVGEWEPIAPDGPAWFHLEPVSGSSTGEWVEVKLSFNAAGLPNGVYTGAARIMAEGALHAPTSLPVVLTVGNPLVPVTVTPAQWFVDPLGDDTLGDGSAGAPFATLAKAIQSAADGETIQMSTGVYTTAALAVRKSLTIRGMGWNATILQAPESAEQEWGRRLFFADGEAVTLALENLWLRRGRSHVGSAILAAGATVTADRCRFSGHETDLDGGGAVRNLGGSVVLRHCILDRNTTATAGGATYGCDLEDSLVVFNTSGSGGAVAGGGRVTRSTVAHNSGGGVADAVVRDSIVYFNSGGNLTGSEASFSMATPLPAGEGNLNDDPLFEDRENGDFHLCLVSPALNRASGQGVWPALDLFGRPRLVSVLGDLGPLEKQYELATRRLRLEGNLAFGEIPVGLSVTQTLWVINQGNTNLTITSVTAPAGFTATPAAFVLGVGASNSVDVVFTPTVAGVYGGEVTVVSDADGSPHSKTASGTGATVPALILLNPPLVNVDVVEGQNAANEAMTVQNGNGSGAMPFTVQSDAFWVSPSPASGTSTGDVVNVALVFNTWSLSYGSYIARITVTSGAATNSPVTGEVRLHVLPGQVPAQPAPITPSNGSVRLMGPEVTFAWTTAARAEQYLLWIGTNGVFFTNAWTTGESATNVTVTARFRPGEYLWMVAGSNWLGFGAWSTTSVFTVTRLMEPSGGFIFPAALMPTFRWTETPDSIAYELDVQRYDAAAGVFAPFLVHGDVTPAGEWTAGTLFTKGAYRWRLREHVDGDWEGWSGWAYFQVRVPAQPTPMAPIGTLYKWSNVRFRWTRVATATGYQVQVRKNGVPFLTTGWQTGVKANLALDPPPGTYRWRVRARNAAGAGAWSVWAVAKMKWLQAPSGLSPAGGQTIPPGTLTTFQWNPAPGANRYELEVLRGGVRLDFYRLFGADTQTYTAALPYPTGWYEWRIRAGNGDVWSAWSAPASFRVP